MQILEIIFRTIMILIKEEETHLYALFSEIITSSDS
jgi:hypothetical protein